MFFPVTNLEFFDNFPKDFQSYKLSYFQIILDFLNNFSQVSKKWKSESHRTFKKPNQDYLNNFPSDFKSHRSGFQNQKRGCLDSNFLCRFFYFRVTQKYVFKDYLIRQGYYKKRFTRTCKQAKRKTPNLGVLEVHEKMFVLGSYKSLLWPFEVLKNQRLRSSKSSKSRFLA